MADRPVNAAREVRRPPHLALAAGHHNHDSGNATEIALTGPLTGAIAQACRAAGIEVRLLTPDEGTGIFTGSLQAMAQRVVDWDRAGWPVDLFLEIHTEGVADPRVRGCFAIYPDWGDDVDVDVRDRLGPDLVGRLSAATGLPIRRVGERQGLMSERQTGVGQQGSRLGVFLRTAPLKTRCTRLLLECGAHTSPADLAILQQAGCPARMGRAVAEAIGAFCGQAPAGLRLPGNPHDRAEAPIVLDGAFRARWEALGPLAQPTLGWPQANASRALVADVERTVQVFDRAVLAWYPADGPDGRPADDPAVVRCLPVDEAGRVAEALMAPSQRTAS